MRIGTGAVLGAVIVWPGKSVVAQGPVPGDSDLRYFFNGDEGTLSFVRQTGSESETIAVAHQGRDGIFFERETGTPVARAIGGSLVFDAESLAEAANETPARARAEASASVRSETDEPQLCPDPGPDVPHGASPRAIAYQAQISALNNPQRPLPPGLAVSLLDPPRERTSSLTIVGSAMVEAKGPGYADMLQDGFFRDRILPARWKDQARRQIAASGGRDIDWFFAEPEAATAAQKLFSNAPGLEKVKVIHTPAIAP